MKSEENLEDTLCKHGKLFYKGKAVPDEKGRIDWLKKMHVE